MASDPGLSLPDRITQLKNLSHALTGLKLIHEAEAAWLAERDRRNEAVVIYEWLLRQPWQNPWEIQRCQANIATLKG